jgi:hypothetical protein
VKKPMVGLRKSYYMPATKNCLYCERALKGRSDKKFCTDHCRNAWNNQLKGPANNLMRSINNALGKNRRILESLLPHAKETSRANRERMLQLGFQFQYLTHTYTTRSGKTYCYCYDYGYLSIDKDWFIVVKNKA